MAGAHQARETQGEEAESIPGVIPGWALLATWRGFDIVFRAREFCESYYKGSGGVKADFHFQIATWQTLLEGLGGQVVLPSGNVKGWNQGGSQVEKNCGPI